MNSSGQRILQNFVREVAGLEELPEGAPTTQRLVEYRFMGSKKVATKDHVRGLVNKKIITKEDIIGFYGEQ